MVAIECTVTGAILLDATATPVPSLIVLVLVEASAMHAKGSPQIICESGNQAWLKPRSSANLTSVNARSGLVNISVPKSMRISFFGFIGSAGARHAERISEKSFVGIPM
jgi:hypothetical protein